MILILIFLLFPPSQFLPTILFPDLVAVRFRCQNCTLQQLTFLVYLRLNQQQGVKNGLENPWRGLKHGLENPCPGERILNDYVGNGA